MKYLKTAFIAGAILVATIILIYFFLVYQNTKDVVLPETATIQASRDKAVQWVLDNQDELLKINNPTLWWFLDQSAALGDNKTLADLVIRYRTDTLRRNSIWSGYWIKKKPIAYKKGSLDYLDKYQRFFIYGFTCNKDLGKEAFIQEQLKLSFCDWKPYYSSCSTHQLMSILLLEQTKCDNRHDNNELTRHLVNKIENQIIWDPRVGDVYLQRVLMLLESGNADKIKPVWIRRIITEQRDNGSWANFYTLIKIGDYELGFGYKTPDIRKKPTASLHATAQAIYVLSLVLDKPSSL